MAIGDYVKTTWTTGDTITATKENNIENKVKELDTTFDDYIIGILYGVKW